MTEGSVGPAGKTCKARAGGAGHSAAMHPHLSMLAARAILLLACLGPCATAFADDVPWRPDGDSDGIALFTRQIPGQPLRDFKGIVQIDAPMAQVAATLADVSTMHEWFFLLREARFVRGAYTPDAHMYMSIKGIWPMSDRDVVAHVTVRQDPVTLAIHIDARNEDGVMPPQPGHVRIPRMKSSWTLRPVSAGRTEVELQGHGDPGGWIPLSIANFVVTTLPRQCLQKLRVHVARPEYRDMDKVYARNPKLREMAGRLVFPGR